MNVTWYIDLAPDPYRGTFTGKEEYVEFAHEWMQVCGELIPESRCGKLRSAEQDAYDLYRQKVYENKFVAKYWRNK